MLGSLPLPIRLGLHDQGKGKKGFVAATSSPFPPVSVKQKSGWQGTGRDVECLRESPPGTRKCILRKPVAHIREHQNRRQIPEAEPAEDQASPLPFQGMTAVGKRAPVWSPAVRGAALPQTWPWGNEEEVGSTREASEGLSLGRRSLSQELSKEKIRGEMFQWKTEEAEQKGN